MHRIMNYRSPLRLSYLDTYTTIKFFIFRISNRRDACVLMKLPEDWEPLTCSTKSYLSNALKCFGNIILTIPGKVKQTYSVKCCQFLIG